MNFKATISMPIDDVQKALALAPRIVATAPATPSARLHALQEMADYLREHVRSGRLNTATVADKIFEVAALHGLSGEPGSDKEAAIMRIAISANLPLELHPTVQFDKRSNNNPLPMRPSLEIKTPAAWKGTEPLKQRWLAAARIPCGDLTLYSGNGGAGKTETAVQLLVSVAAGLGDWLGCVVETGPALFLSCEEPEPNVRDRIERICTHRHIDPYVIDDLHLYFPDLEATWLATADRLGKVAKTALLQQVEAWINAHRPIVVVIDSIAAVFDGEAIARRQVRSFLAMLRKIRAKMRRPSRNLATSNRQCRNAQRSKLNRWFWSKIKSALRNVSGSAVSNRGVRPARACLRPNRLRIEDTLRSHRDRYDQPGKYRRGVNRARCRLPAPQEPCHAVRSSARLDWRRASSTTLCASTSPVTVVKSPSIA